MEDTKTTTLSELLEAIDVIPPGMWENELSDLLDWWAVTNEVGIIAYFGNEVDALRFRLDYINRILNP